MFTHGKSLRRKYCQWKECFPFQKLIQDFKIEQNKDKGIEYMQNKPGSGLIWSTMDIVIKKHFLLICSIRTRSAVSRGSWAVRLCLPALLSVSGGGQTCWRLSHPLASGQPAGCPGLRWQGGGEGDGVLRLLPWSPAAVGCTSWLEVTVPSAGPPCTPPPQHPPASGSRCSFIAPRLKFPHLVLLSQAWETKLFLTKLLLPCTLCKWFSSSQITQCLCPIPSWLGWLMYLLPDRYTYWMLLPLGSLLLMNCLKVV